MTEPLFDKVLRGYDPVEVDRVVEVMERALISQSESAMAEAAALARSAAFRVVMRGYNRGQVDRYVELMVTELTAT